jgi:hypothetical protein
MISVALKGENGEGGNNVSYTSDLVRHMARRSIQSTEDDCWWPPRVAERHQRELGIGHELAR